MNSPPFNFTLRDNDKNIDYVVYAYRKLTREEVVQAVRVFRSSPQGKKVVRNKKYKFITSIGAD